MTDERIIGLDASRSYRAFSTGTERYSRRLIEHLLRLETPGCRYRLYFNDPPPADAALPNAEIRTLPARRLWTHYRLSRELRANPVDLLFVPAHVLPLLHSTRSVVTVHDLGYLHEPRSHTLNSRIHLRATTLWNARRATHLIAISESTRRDLIRHCGVCDSKITVIQHGVDERFCVLPSHEIERYRRAARLPDRFILYVGTVQPRKNLLRLLTAFEQVAADDPEAHLIIAGKVGWLSEPIHRSVHESRFRDRMRLLGHVPDPQLPHLYNTATAFVMPSLYEGFGLPVLEAMACGVPAVMSDRGALPELAGADTIVVDPLDTGEIAAGLKTAMSARFDKSNIQERLAHTGRFRWDDTARNTRQVLLDALNHEPDTGS